MSNRGYQIDKCPSCGMILRRRTPEQNDNSREVVELLRRCLEELEHCWRCIEDEWGHWDRTLKRDTKIEEDAVIADVRAFLAKQGCR